jgi:hypothetical protein
MFTNVVGQTQTKVRVTNNTAYIPTDTRAVNGLWLSENGVLNCPLELTNNLVAAGAGIPTGNRVVGVSQTISLADYNDYWHVTTPYPAGITVTSGLTHDIAADPHFYDPTRTLQTWGSRVKGLDGTYAAVRDLFLGRGGYQSATKTRTGAAYACPVSDLASWVRAGYRPTNRTLLTAGSGGTCIGAVQPAPWTVTATAGAGGTASVGSQPYYGETATVTAAPSAGYVVDAWSGTCGGSGSGNAYTTAAVTADCSVGVMFKAEESATRHRTDGLYVGHGSGWPYARRQ